eukprot:1159619-Pelagomonas_calceolata.AAC.7
MPSSRVEDRLAGSSQELPAKPIANVSIAPGTASHAPLTLQDSLKLLFGRVAKIPWRWVCWASQGSRCELFRETGKPRGSRPMNGASPKRPTFRSEYQPFTLPRENPAKWQKGCQKGC